MTDISINAGLTASLIPQTPSAFGFEPAQGNSFYDALQGTSSIKAVDAVSLAAGQSAQSPESAAVPQNTAVSQSTANQNGYAQSSAAANSYAAETGYEPVSQTVPAYDSYIKTEGITVSPETVEELASLLAEKTDIPSAYEQAKQALEAAMLKAINDLNDPELQEEEAKEKLLLALMKFLEKLNGEPEKETALDNGDDEKEFRGILMEIVEHLIESARKQKDPDSDLDGNVPLTEIFVPQAETADPIEPTEKLKFEKVETKPLLGTDQLRSDRRVRTTYPSSQRIKAELDRQPIPVPTDPRKGKMTNESALDTEGQAETKADISVQAPVSDDNTAELLQTAAKPADDLQTAPVINTENKSAETIGTVRNTDTVQDISTSQNVSAIQDTDTVQNTDTSQNVIAVQDTNAVQDTDTSQNVSAVQNTDTSLNISAVQNVNTSRNINVIQNVNTSRNISAVQNISAVRNPSRVIAAVDGATASETGTQQVQSSEKVQSSSSISLLTKDTELVNEAGAVEKIQDSRFVPTGGGIFVIEFLENGSNGLPDYVLGEVRDYPEELVSGDNSNAPEKSGNSDISDLLPVQGAENSETDTPAQNTAADNAEETIKPSEPSKPLESEEEIYSVKAEKSVIPENPVKETENVKAPEAKETQQLSDGEETMYSKLAENVYRDVYETFKNETDQIQQVQPVSDLTPIQKPNVSDRKAVSDELDELSRLFGIRKEPEVKQLPIDDEDSDKPSEISKETPVEEISVVSSKVPDAPRTIVFDLGESGIKQVVTQIVTEIMHNLPQRDGETTLTMTLNPESLGRISIKLVENAGKLSVSIVAENKETAAMLASRYENIQESLRDNGTQLEKYQVVYGAEQDGRAEQQNYEGSSKNPYVRQDEEHDEGNDGQFRELLEKAV